MKKYKNKIITAVVIVAALTITWFWGGNYNKSNNSAQRNAVQKEENSSSYDNVTISLESPGMSQSPDMSETPEGVDSPDIANTPSNDNESSGLIGDSISNEDDDDILSSSKLPGQSSEVETGGEDRPTSGDERLSSGEDRQTSEQNTTDESTKSSEPGSNDNSNPVLDKYLTSQVPEGRPAPVEPQDMTAGDDSFTVTLTVRCDMILDNMNLLDKEKHELVPEDGVIFPTTTVTVYEGESVFNVLQREMRRAGIHMTFRNTPIYNSAYIEAINNLYEFDVGELSGWMYKVNGWFPNYGCSRYKLQPGDEIEWLYTCDLGRDLGEYWLGAGWGQMDD